MDLFSSNLPETHNWLPYDGEVYYWPFFMEKAKADHYYTMLTQEVPWEYDVAQLYGKRLVTKRQIAWYGDNAFAYTYSGTTKLALLWNPTLNEIKNQVECQLNQPFNSCLLNRYPTGEVGMGWHADDERELGKNTCIASVSLGAERKFLLKHKHTAEKVAIHLLHGSLLVMKGTTQQNWLHSIPVSKKVLKPRINLTFRTFRPI